MTWLGLTHVLLMTGALAVGAGLLAATKGTFAHRQWGRVFVAAVLVSDLIVLAIYQDTPRFGVFHLLAVVSFASVLAGLALVRARKGGIGLRIAHGHVMLWCFGGMVAAGLGQASTLLGYPPWPVILATLLGVGAAAVRLDFKDMLSAR